VSLLDGFLARAMLAGAGVALTAGPLGCFVLWRRMAYFGDATAHATLLGVALSLAISAPVVAGAVVVAAAMGLILTALVERGHGEDALLGVLSHSALAAGLVAVSVTPGVRTDLSVYLFGDILAVGRGDLALIAGGAALVLGVLAWRWDRLLTATLDPDLARAGGVDPVRERLILTLGLAVVVAVAIEVVGALLITALLIIPAAAARPFAATPERMAALAAGIGAGSALAGLWASWTFDTPAGPSIVCAAAVAFAGAMAWQRAR
jgi:zinc transport system permease protein